MKKKVLSLALVLLMIFSFTPMISVQARALTAEEMVRKFAELKAKYPTGWYWADGWCNDYTTGDCGPGYNNVAWECMGFAYKLCTELFEEESRSTFYTHSNIDNLCVGDYVRRNGHSFVVTNISGNTVYYVDCNGYNGYGYNVVCWERSMTKSQLSSGLEHIKTQYDNWIKTLDGYGDTQKPTISNYRVSNVNANSITVTADLNDNVGVTRVWLNIYGPSGSNGYAVSASNGNFTHTINTAEYGGAGLYSIHLYAFDGAGNETSSSISNIYATTGTGDKTWITTDKTKYKVGETVSFNFGYKHGTSVSLGIDKDGVRYSTPEVTGTTSYSLYLTEPGVYEAYSSGWSQDGYEDSEKISFIVYTEENYPYEYILSFDANGGTVSTANKTIINNSSYGELPTPTRAGYTFNGWYTESAGGTRVTSDTIVTAKSNHTLYAHWTNNKPYTDSTVKRYDYTNIANYEFPYKYIINTALYNIASDCNIIATGYKNGRLVSIAIKPYSQENESFEFTGDIDEIKIMLWGSLSLMKPLSDIENIMSDEWELFGVGTATSPFN